jgi:transposase-like protein
MENRDPKTQFTNVACPNKTCKLYGLTDHGNVIGNGTYISRGEKTRRYHCNHCGKVFNDHTDTFYHDLRKDEKTIDLALKMSMKGMSNETIANV